MTRTFSPGYGTGKTDVTGASTSGTIKANSSSAVFTNLGSVTVYVRITAAASTATIDDYPVLAGTQVSLGKSAGDTHITHISPDGAGSLHYIAGAGL